MGFALPNGSHVYLASGYDPAVPFTGATNAEHAVVTVESGGGFASGDVVHVNCDWTGIDNVVALVDAVAGSAVTLRNINTTNTGKFPAGGGSGTLRKVTEWTEIPQITEVANAGGEQNTTQIQFLSDDRQRNLNTYKSASSQTYTIAHDSSLPVYPLLRQLDEDEETVAAYMYVPKAKENRYWAATASFNDIPQTAVNSVETVTAVLNLQSPAMTFYKTDNVTTPAVQVTGVTLNETKLDLDAGETTQLVAEVTPADATNKQVTWSSSNEEVAKVSADGLVTAMAGVGGTTIITCTTVDGGKTATCEVTETVA